MTHLVNGFELDGNSGGVLVGLITASEEEDGGATNSQFVMAWMERWVLCIISQKIETENCRN